MKITSINKKLLDSKIKQKLKKNKLIPVGKKSSEGTHK